MKPNLTILKSGFSLVSAVFCFLLAGCDGDTGGGKAPDGKPKNEVALCRIQVEASTAKAAALSGARIRQGCALSEQAFLDYTRKFQ